MALTKVEELEAEWYADVEERAKVLDKEFSGLASLLVEVSRTNYFGGDEESYLQCLAGLKEQNAANSQGIFQPLLELTRKLFSPYTADLMDYIVEHVTEYPYSTGYSRRPFRTQDVELYGTQIFTKLSSLLVMERIGFSLPDYLQSKDNDSDYTIHYRIRQVLSDCVAYDLDRKDGEMLELLKGIVYGDNQGALLSNEIIKGVFMSHQSEAAAMMGELLVAARLQEGLRQSLVERMDEGTLENCLYMLKLIIDNDFVRYSSVVRAIGVWTGMGLEAQNQRVAKQLVNGAYQMLTDASLREQWLSDPNANHVYLSLWATAVHEEADLNGKLSWLMAEGQLYQKIVAQYVLANSQNQEVRLASARQYLEEQDPELHYWILANYSYQYHRMWRPHDEDGPKIEVRRSPQLEEKSERRRDFELFKKMFLNPVRHEWSGPSKVLDFVHLDYSRDALVHKMLYLTAYDMDSAWTAEIIALKDELSADLRGELLNGFMNNLEEPQQREFLFASLADKSMKNRELALKEMKTLTLTEEEQLKAEVLLKLKTGSLRQSVTLILLNQPDPALEGSITRLLQGKNSLQRLAALELVTILFEDEQRADLYQAVRPLVEAITEPAPKERELISKLGRKNEYTKADGFGLFNPRETEPWLTEGSKLENFSWDEVFSLPAEKIKAFLQGLDGIIHEHRDVEYEAEYYSGHKDTLLLGTDLRVLKWVARQEDETAGSELEQYPLHEVWSAYLQDSGWQAKELLELNFYLLLGDVDETLDQYYRFFNNSMSYQELRKHKLLEGWRGEFTEQVYPLPRIREVEQLLKGLSYRRIVHTLVHAYFADSDKKANFQLIDRALNTLMATMPEDKLESEKAILHVLAVPWLSMETGRASDLADFKTRFGTFYTFDRMTRGESESSVMSLRDYCKAFKAGFIGEGELFKELLGSGESRNHMRNMTSRNYTWIESSPKIMELWGRAVARILDIELVRGDLPTEVTPLVMGLQRIEGMEYFIRILAGLDKETFIRGYVYGYGDNITKKESFSHLLKVSHPKDGEDAALLKKMLKDVGLTDKHLLEAAMYAPQWIEIIAEYLGWDGIRSAAWYFHAHINESFSAEKETVVAHYSPIQPQDFNDGAFDVNWFQAAYHTLGKERFDLLYECAKYISAGANHRRSQLFADATLGKLKLAEMKQSVEQKRNKDHLLSYSLIPLGETHEQDVRERYELIQKFLTESKKFGAQRRASEGLAARIALGNLARNAGYADVTRLMWDIEARKLDELESYFQPHALDEDTTAKLLIGDNGQSELVITSKGKELKSVPARFKKNEYIEALKEIKSELTGQFRRARLELERSMETGNAFTLQEITGLSQNPILSPLIRTLVLKSGAGLGYFAAETASLIDPSGTAYLIGPADALYIAHPLDLYKSGQWSQYQKDLFDRQERQPFKQIFRELYLPNADELADAALSRRYAGHQVQPKKTVALLRERHWTVSYEEGLQKVFYGENLIVRLYALADWFSPADTEAPTLETVQFFDRTTYKPVLLTQVPALVFSEVMREIDLVVSVAHVGGVDPEASLTTVEMRRVIVNESVRLLKLGNVRIDGNYARIEGTLGEYAVHLGSGMVYKQASGAMFIIPVHSQHRGRLFLPFLDEDPKTAEILSKVVLLAEDTKIKDPQILQQLKG